jgi:hypothetical protein
MKNLLKLSFFSHILVLIALALFVGCQKNSFPNGGAKEEQASFYTVQPNISGGVIVKEKKD